MIAILAVYVLVIFRIVNVPAKDRSSIFGDGYSDRNTLASARYFHDHGFIKTAFLPVHDYPPEAGAWVYTHYPALPNILAGVYSKLSDSGNEPILRIFPAILSILLLLLIFKALMNTGADRKWGFYAALVLMLSNYFIAWADNLHKHLYEELINWTSFLLLYAYHHKGGRDKRILFLLILLAIAGTNISFEQPVFMFVLNLGFTIVYRKKAITVETIAIALAIITGFALHLMQNYIYLGSMDAVILDMKNAFIFRTSGQSIGGYVSEQPFSIVRNAWEIPFNWFNRMERYFLFPGWALLAIILTTGSKLRQRTPEAIKLMLVTFAAAAAWGIAMPQHEFIHSFTNRHFSIFYGLAIAFCLPLYFEQVKNDFHRRKPFWIAFHIILLAYTFWMFLSQQIWDLWLRNGFLCTLQA